MKKILIVSALLVSASTFVAAGTNKLEPHTVVPVIKADATHHDQNAHDEAQMKHAQKSKEEYIKEIQAAITENKEFVEKNKSAVPATKYNQALMKISVAEQWMKTVESYKDPTTRCVRSFNYAISELKSAKGDMKVRKKGKEISDEVVKKGLEKLSEKSKALLKEKESFTFHEENNACFNMMLKSALEYITLANKPEYKETFRHLSKRAHKYLSDARKFLRAHKPQKQKAEKVTDKTVTNAAKSDVSSATPAAAPVATLAAVPAIDPAAVAVTSSAAPAVTEAKTEESKQKVSAAK